MKSAFYSRPRTSLVPGRKPSPSLILGFWILGFKERKTNNNKTKKAFSYLEILSFPDKILIMLLVINCSTTYSIRTIISYEQYVPEMHTDDVFLAVNRDLAHLVYEAKYQNKN